MSHLNHKISCGNIAKIDHPQVLVVLCCLFYGDPLIWIMRVLRHIQVENWSSWETQNVHLGHHRHVTKIDNGPLMQHCGGVIYFISSDFTRQKLRSVIVTKRWRDMIGQGVEVCAVDLATKVYWSDELDGKSLEKGILLNWVVDRRLARGCLKRLFRTSFHVFRL